MTITTEPYNNQKLIDYICNGETLIILLHTQEMIRLNGPDFVHRTPDEPENEHVLRGSHEGLVENFDSNMSLIRKRIKNNKLIVKKFTIGKETKTSAYYFYVDGVVDKGALKTVEERLQAIDLDMFYSVGQLSDYLDDQVWSPFPQLLNTERPDRVVANILEGKIAIMTDVSPTALIGPVTFFSFYQSPDDFNARVLVGTFYRIMRMFSFLSAIFLPAFYIAIVSFHFEVLPLELANKVKSDINQIPYRPLIEALIMEITIELIREASVRLPKSIGQTIGIVGGLVIGESIVSAGLVSNLMVIVVAFTAISSFVVPSVELNTSIRMLRFPFMLMAAMFGFFGIVIGTFLLVIHLLNLSSLKRPYFSPIIPFEPKELYKIFFREPYYKARKQATGFSPKKDDEA
ncbi:MAG: spore germination protein [Lysinibacillus sp.]